MSNPIQNSEYVMLREAIKKKDKVTAQNLIQNNASVNIPNAKGGTPLHWATIKFRDLDIMTMLLEKGADIHAKDHRNQKPLEVAIKNHKTEAVSLLIKNGALDGEDLNSLLLMAIKHHNFPIVKSLIDYSIKNNISINLKVPLQDAICGRQFEVVEYILPHYKFLEPSDKYIFSEAVIYSSPPNDGCIDLLLKWNFTVNPDSKYDTEFVYAAVEKGYLPIVLELLKFGIDVNFMNPKTGLNLLKVACLKKHHEIIENLLKHNARVNETTITNTKISNTDLYKFSKNYKHYHPFPLINNKINPCDVTCLHITVLNADLKMTKLLLEYGAKIVDDPTFFNITCMAVQSNCEEIVRMFLDRGVDVNGIDCEGKSLLHFCILDGEKEDLRYKIAELLLEKGAKNNIQTPGNFLIFEAINNGHHKIANLFLEHNADIQYISPEGNTILHEAVENYLDVEFIKTLLQRNLQVNAVNKNMLTPLHLASIVQSKYQLQIIKTLIHYNANINCTTHHLMTPLHFVCQTQKFQSIKVLLRKGANPNAINNKGETPLYFSCAQHRNSMTSRTIQSLLLHHADIEAVDKKGWTPLFIACEARNNVAVNCLLDNHANANHTDLDNLTPLYVAAKHCRGNSEIVNILLKHKANVHCMNEQGNSVIHVIVDKENEELIHSLAHTQINFNSVNKEGNTPLHIAVQKASIKMTKNLIKYGANVNILDNKNQTSLKTAIDFMVANQSKLQNLHDRISSMMGRSSYNNSDDENMISTYRNSISNYKKIIKILKKRVVKLKAAGLKVNNQNFKIVYDSVDNDRSNDEFSKTKILKLEVECAQEIEQMRTERTGVHEMTFYDLLTKNIHYLCRFVKNKYIRQLLELKEYDEKFPLYIDIVRSRFRDAKFRYRMMNSAKKYFTSHITQRLSDDCIDSVFSYLQIKELKMFIRAMKLLNG